MSPKLLFLALLLLLGSGPLSAQTNVASAAHADVNPAAPPPRDPVDMRVTEALRTRDAIIRNLLERVQELENRLNGTAGASAAPKTVTPLRTAGPSSDIEVSSLSAGSPITAAPATPRAPRLF